MGQMGCRVFLAGLVVSGCSTVLAENWPQWRGPQGRGISQEAGIVAEWSPEKNIVWKAEIPGRGHSSPVVWEDRIFLTSSAEGRSLDGPTAPDHLLNGEKFAHPDWTGSDREWSFRILALERSSGKVLWERTAYEGPVYDHRHRANTYASSTPVTDGKKLWVYFGSEGLYCYDLDGNLLWQKSFGGIGTVGMGTGTSPVIFEDKIILVVDQEFDGLASFMVALSRDTGEEVWRVKRDHRITWATPLLVPLGSRTLLLVGGAESNVAYNPVDGRELWRTEGLVSHAIPTPVTDGQIAVFSAGSQEKRTIAVDLEKSVETPHVMWSYDKGSAYVPSPIFYGPYVYVLSDKGIITCLDGRTGEVVYEGGRMPEASSVKASPVAFDGKILITNEEGQTFVVKAGPQFEVLATNSVGEPVWASPAVSDGIIYIRGAQHLFAIGKPAPPAGE